MEIPVKLNFFRKLELYQELKRENKKAKNGSGTLRELWKMEKILLAWASKSHHHRNFILKNIDIQNKIEESYHPNSNEMNNELGHIQGNLISRGFASKQDDGITITQEGFLMGQVINDSDSLKGYLYNFFIFLTWTTILTGAFSVIINFFNLLIMIYKKIN